MDKEKPGSSNDEEPPKKKAKCFPTSSSQKDLVSLPFDVLVNIFKHLDLKSINSCAMLCSTFNNVSKDSSLYKKVTLKYNMNTEFLESLVSKVSYPKELYIEYRFANQSSDVDESKYTEFNKYVGRVLRKCGEHLYSLKIESCRNEEVLLNISECTNLKKLCLYRCKSTFKTLSSITTLTYINFLSCHFLQKTASEVIKNNPELSSIFLSDNVNVNVNEICENMSKHNNQIKEIHLSERKKIKTKSLRSLAGLSHLNRLELISGPGFECDPEDALELLAAGCPKLERLVIYGWKEINDDNFIPALHMFSQLKELDLRGINITIKSCREAALNLPLLKLMDVIKCRRVRKAQLQQLQRDFTEIDIPLE